jgi:ribonuclease III
LSRAREATTRAALEAQLEHRFRDAALLDVALTHSSLATGRGQRRFGFDRMEFLGDRVLALVVAELLVEAFPEENEGDLGRRFAALVSAPSLAEIADELDLARHLRVAPSEMQADGQRSRSVLADAFEAVLGALFRDGGYAAAERFLRRVFVPRILARQAPPRDPKTTLQELAQGRGASLPVYRVLASGGPAHEPHFTIEVEAMGRRASGEGSSKRLAERAAAQALLDALETS